MPSRYDFEISCSPALNKPVDYKTFSVCVAQKNELSKENETYVDENCWQAYKGQEPRYNKVLGITNDFLIQVYPSNSTIYEKEPRND